MTNWSSSSPLFCNFSRKNNTPPPTPCDDNNDDGDDNHECGDDDFGPTPLRASATLQTNKTPCDNNNNDGDGNDERGDDDDDNLVQQRDKHISALLQLNMQKKDTT